MSGYLSYRDMRIQIKNKIMDALTIAEKQKKDIALDKLKAQMELDYGVGKITVDRIVGNLEELGFIKCKGNTIKKVLQKGSNEPQK